MKQVITCLGLSLALFITSCNNSSDDKKEESLISPAAVNNPAASDPDTTAASVQPASATTLAAPQINTLPAAKGALNPEHGKPGHRCDIAVGAPLDGKPAAAVTTAATPVTNTITPAINTPTAPTGTKSAITTSSSNLNPEHGKPGHRCDIAVGAPLSGAPAKPAAAIQPSTTMTTVPNTQKQAPVTPLLPASTTVAPGMNPEHGKPGHRCDIAVGAPLTSTPKQ
jgi:hypothetical protein